MKGEEEPADLAWVDRLDGTETLDDKLDGRVVVDDDEPPNKSLSSRSTLASSLSASCPSDDEVSILLRLPGVPPSSSSFLSASRRNSRAIAGVFLRADMGLPTPGPT